MPGRDASEATRPWGHKITLSVYVTTPHMAVASDLALKAAAAVDDAVSNVFVGASIEAVQDEPQDQVAT